MEFIDTHCHIHFDDYDHDVEATLEAASQAGVNSLICVGCTLKDSAAGIDFAATRPNCWASIGIHPHEAEQYVGKDELLTQFASLAVKPKVVAVGECGLDYYYNHASKAAQKTLLEYQLALALKHNLPVIFHIRDAFEDFWPIFDNFIGLQGVIHSFTASTVELNEALKRGLSVGLNGIMTFTKDPAQLEMAKQVPIDRLLLETDAPFLTPAPFRGKVCEPKHARVTAEFLAVLRGTTLEEIASSTTRNARTIFRI